MIRRFSLRPSCRSRARRGGRARVGVGRRRLPRQDRARRSRARRGADGARSRRADDGRLAALDGEGLAHVLAKPRGFGIADDARMEAPRRRGSRAHRVAGAARVAGRPAGQLRLRRRGAASGRAAAPAHVDDREQPRPPGARRLARVQGTVHTRGRRSHARPARQAPRRPPIPAGARRSPPLAPRCRARSRAGRRPRRARARPSS